MYSLYLYFLGLSLSNISKALIIFDDEKRSHIAVWIEYQGLVHVRSITKGKEYLHSS
jgi:hypothetical protein